MPRTCFVIMPFSETSSCSEDEWKLIFEALIKPAIEGAGLNYVCNRSTATRGNIVGAIMHDLRESYVVIADLTDQNANVYYELGVRHALKNRTILISQKRDDIPFDLIAYANHIYDWQTEEGKVAFADRITELLNEIDKNPERDDNPVSDFLYKNIKNLSYDEPIVEPTLSPPELRTPKIGDYDVSVHPIFAWSTINSASNYELVVSEDPTFIIIEWAVNTGTQTSYQSTVILRYATTYYWRVRVVVGDRKSPWTTGIFTTQRTP